MGGARKSVKRRAYSEERGALSPEQLNITLNYGIVK